MTTPQVFDRPEDVLAALADPALVPPPATDGPTGSVAWLRARVSRFCAGEPHARRRALIEADLARLDPTALREAAARGFEPDARLRTVRVLAEALGLPEPAAVARAVTVVAGSYFADRPDDPAADQAVAWLLPRMAADGDEELAANRIALLVQSCDATAALVAGEPPVKVMRRVAARETVVGGVALVEGTEVVLDVLGAQRAGGPVLSFGAGPRACPGRAQALGIAAGILRGYSDPGPEDWTFRQLAAHAAESACYADAVGDLSRTEL